MWRTGDVSDRRGFCASMEDRFWRFVVKGDESECWEWTGSLNNKGYGKIGENAPSRKTMLAHRASYVLHNGEIPNGFVVCHRCDNPKCVNPSHLFIGTNIDNVADMIAKGRDYRGEPRKGELHPGAKITADIVRSIRNDDRPLSVIGKEYNITKGHVSNIKRGKVWKHII